MILFLAVFSKWRSVSSYPHTSACQAIFRCLSCLTLFAPYSQFPHFLRFTDQQKRNKPGFLTALRSSTNNLMEHTLRNKFHIHLYQPKWYNMNQKERLRKIKLFKTPMDWNGCSSYFSCLAQSLHACMHSFISWYFAVFWPQTADGIRPFDRPQFT